MPEEVNFDGPFAEGPLGGPQGPVKEGAFNQPKVGMDQTNWESSEEKAAVDGAITDGDAKLGNEIKKQGETLGSEISGVSGAVEAVKSTVESLSDELTSDINDVMSTVTFLAGDAGAEYTPSVIAEGLKSFEVEMEAMIETAQSEDALDVDKRRAQFFINNYGEVYSTIGAVMYILSDFRAVTGDLSSEQMQKYENHVEDLRNDLVGLYENRDALVDEGGNILDAEEYKDVQNKIKKLEEVFVRITAADILNPDVIKLRKSDLDGGIQWYYDEENAADEAFRTDLAVNRIGDANLGDSWKEHKAAFKTAADTARDIIADYEKAIEDEAYEPTDEEKARYEGAKRFEQEFTLIPNVISILSFVQHYEEDRYADFSTEAFEEYVSQISDWKQELEMLTQSREDAESDEERKKIDAIMKMVYENLTKYAELDEFTGEWLNFYPGFVRYYQDQEANEFEQFEKNLRENVIGDVNAGEYYKALSDRFKVESATVRDSVKDLANKPSEEWTKEDEIADSKNKWFEETFGLIANHIAITTFNYFEDDYLAADFSEEAYDEYVSNIEDKKAELADAKQSREDAETDEERKELDMIIKLVTKDLSEYTCELNGEYRVCEAGFVVWAQAQHDSDEESFRAENTEVIGITPSSSVFYLSTKKEEFAAEIKEAKTILDDPNSDPSLVEAALSFITRFGESVNATSYANWSLFKRELEISEAIGSIEDQIICSIEGLANTIENAVTLTSTHNAEFFPLPNGKIGEFTLCVEGDFKVVSVSRNGIEQLNGGQFFVEGTQLVFAPGNMPNANDSIIVTVEKTNRVSVGAELCNINLPSSLTQGLYSCKAIQRAITSLESMVDGLQSAINELDGSIDYDVTLISKLDKLITERSENIKKAGERLLELAADKKSVDESIAKYTADLKEINTNLSDATQKLADANESLATAELDISDTENRVETLNEAISLEESRAYPDAGVLAKLAAQVKASKADLDVLQDEKKAHEDSIVKNQTEVDTLTGDRDGQLDNLAEAESNRGEITSEVESLENDNFVNQIDSKLLVSKKANAEKSKTVKEDQKSETEATLASTQKTLAETKNTAADICGEGQGTTDSFTKSASSSVKSLALEGSREIVEAVKHKKDGEEGMEISIPVLEVPVYELREGEGGQPGPAMITVSGYCQSHYGTPSSG